MDKVKDNGVPVSFDTPTGYRILFMVHYKNHAVYYNLFYYNCYRSHININMQGKTLGKTKTVDTSKLLIFLLSKRILRSIIAADR